MKLFEEICDKYYRREEDLEKDLMAVLRNKSTEEVLPGHINGDYKMALMDLLEKMRLGDISEGENAILAMSELKK